MRNIDPKVSLFTLSILAFPGCQDTGAASTDTPTTTTTSGVPTSSAPTMGPANTSTTAGDFTTSSVTDAATGGEGTGIASSSTSTSDPSTSTTTSGEHPVDTTGATTTGDSTGGASTSSTTLDTTTDDEGSTTDAPEPAPCFPKQVPWAQPCQAGVEDVQVLANIPNSAYGIAVDETHVYFTDYSPPGSPKLHRVSKCGGAVETMASAGGNPCRIEMDHLFVYISDLVNNGAIYRVAKSNGSVGVVAANLSQTCPSLVVTDDAVLFSGHPERGIWKASKFWGGQPELAYDTGEKYPGWIETEGVFIYWNQTWQSDVGRFPITGGESEFVTDALGSYPFEVSCEHVYSNSPISPGYWRAPVNGGPPQKVALESAHRSVMGDTHVYFTAGGSHKIIEVPLAGGAPTVVAEIGNPGLLAVDATHIFWSDPDSPVIRISPRPNN